MTAATCGINNRSLRMKTKLSKYQEVMGNYTQSVLPLHASTNVHNLPH